MELKTKILLVELNTMLKKRGLETGGKVQQFIDSEMMRMTDKYVPFDSGKLKDSAVVHTRVGSGELRYKTPYARRQYFENQGEGLRGKKWFERSKADNKKTILRRAIEVAGAKK